MFQNVCPSLSSDYEWSRWTDIHNTYIHNIHIHINVHKQYNKQHTYIDVYSTKKCFKMRVRVFRPLQYITVHHIVLQYITLHIFIYASIRMSNKIITIFIFIHCHSLSASFIIGRKTRTHILEHLVSCQVYLNLFVFKNPMLDDDWWWLMTMLTMKIVDWCLHGLH